MRIRLAAHRSVCRLTTTGLFILSLAGCTSAPPSTTGGSSASPSTAATATAAPTTASAQLLTVNGVGGDSSLPAAWKFQIQYPSRYLATSDSMLEGYNSQGGMAPPRLALVVGLQPLPPSQSVVDLLKSGDRDCIVIWSTRGFGSVSDWERIIRPDATPQVISERSEKIGNFNVLRREVAFSASASHSLEAFIALPQNLSYFFNTCNVNSQADLQTVLQSFRVRAG